MIKRGRADDLRNEPSALNCKTHAKLFEIFYEIFLPVLMFTSTPNAVHPRLIFADRGDVWTLPTLQLGQIWGMNTPGSKIAYAFAARQGARRN